MLRKLVDHGELSSVTVAHDETPRHGVVGEAGRRELGSREPERRQPRSGQRRGSGCRGRRRSRRRSGRCRWRNVGGTIRDRTWCRRNHLSRGCLDGRRGDGPARVRGTGLGGNLSASVFGRAAVYFVRRGCAWFRRRGNWFSGRRDGRCGWKGGRSKPRLEFGPLRQRPHAAEILAARRVNCNAHCGEPLEHHQCVGRTPAQALRPCKEGHQRGIVFRPELHRAPCQVVEPFVVLAGRGFDCLFAAVLPRATVGDRTRVLSRCGDERENEECVGVNEGHASDLHVILHARAVRRAWPNILASSAESLWSASGELPRKLHESLNATIGSILVARNAGT